VVVVGEVCERAVVLRARFAGDGDRSADRGG
jgi:hypothetical protein